MEQSVIKRVNAYIDLIAEIIANKKYEHYTVNSYYFLMKPQCTTYDYIVLKYKIINEMLEMCKQISNIEAFILALFGFKSGTKICMYNNRIEFTIDFKICNKVLCAAYNILKNGNCYEYVYKSEYEKVQYLFNLAYIYYVNMNTYNHLLLVKYNKNNVEVFEDKLWKVSTVKDDMNSYNIKNKDIKYYLEVKKMNDIIFQKNMYKSLNERYVSEMEVTLLDTALISILNQKNQSTPNDDIIVISKKDYEKINSGKFKQFLDIFSINKHSEMDRDENELAFAYFDTGYVYCSKIMMRLAQELIEKFLKWCQYENLMCYYYNIKKIKENKNYYNKIMTYKIADRLLLSQYVLPMEKKTINNKKLILPRVEIKKPLKSKSPNDLGDYDVLFYSPHTRILYSLEYKNYQMLITEEGCFGKEIEKVEKDNVVSQALKREKYLLKNLDSIKNNLFLEKIDIKEVKTIILTTKPNLYFYVNRSDDYLYYEWNEFERKIVDKVM